MDSLQLRPAERTKAKLRIGLSGPSGSGKTYSALLLASGIASDWNKIALIDTENGSGDLYSHLGAYNVITLTEPYSPEHYIEAIKACEQAGMEVIIVDSVTHEWDGKGGCLELNDALANSKYKGNTWAAWSSTTPRHQKFIESITRSTCHVITTVRNKQDTVQVDGKVKKVGTKEIQREGFEYELTVNFNLDREHNTAMASKDRTELFTNVDPFVISWETGAKLSEWANSGKDAPTPPAKPRFATDEQKKLLKIWIIGNVEAAKQPAAIQFIDTKITEQQAAEKIVEYGINTAVVPVADPHSVTDQQAADIFGTDAPTLPTPPPTPNGDTVSDTNSAPTERKVDKEAIRKKIAKIEAMMQNYDKRTKDYKEMEKKIAELNVELL